MLIKTVLNQLENFKEFVFGKVRLRKRWFEKPTLVVDILPEQEAVPNVRCAAGKDRYTIPAEGPGRSSIFPCGTTEWFSASSLAGSTVPGKESR